jgi:hypothetical protein
MDQNKKDITGKVVTSVAWMFVLALMYLVFQKFKLVFHL